MVAWQLASFEERTNVGIAKASAVKVWDTRAHGVLKSAVKCDLNKEFDWQQAQLLVCADA